ncbi:unnamed protein product, partial [Larinioides sclopetarius]
RQTDIIPKLCFSDSGRSKTWRFVKISSSNFLTITILSLYEKVKIKNPPTVKTINLTKILNLLYARNVIFT